VQATPQGTAFDSHGMWIWELPRSDGGNLDAIAARARAAGVTTLFIKSSDGSHTWRQFSTPLVQALHARGLRACAWGYVYGLNPRGEARAARTAIKAGADCFVIDAEAEYEGRYAAADVYTRKLRSYAGSDYPIGLAPFPYVDYHPAFPYSVFLGPRGAQFNLPQIYWHTIGTTVDLAFAHTYAYSTLYSRPIYPLGQTYGGTPPAEIVRFRQLAFAYGARGISWWSWQATPASGWSALTAPLRAVPAATSAPPFTTRVFGRGSRGDLVVWAQQHLLSTGQPVAVNGVFDKATSKAVRAFQAANGLPRTAVIDAATWRALLMHPAAKVRWRTGRGATAARAGTTAPPPRSARMPARRNELRSKR
jgi:Putative peptidoglycan binding domain